jgi:dTDP-4-dehydrorhamnose reductase
VLKCRKLLSTFGIRQRPWRGELQRVIRELYGVI